MRKKYFRELEQIKEIFMKLAKKKVFEITTKKSDGELMATVRALKGHIDHLLSMIEANDPKQDIKERYYREIDNIDYLLTKVETKQVREFTELNFDGNIPKTIQKAWEEFYDLIISLEDGKPSVQERINKAMNELSFTHKS